MKSGIEMLEELKNSVDLLNKRYEVVEQTMKEILNRMNGFQQPVASMEEMKPTIASTVPTPVLPSKPTIGSFQTSKNSTTKVMGKIKHEGRALIGAEVTVKDSAGKVVKETRTNKAGDWMCFLPMGKYNAKYSLNGILDTSVDFQVTPGQTLLRVAQPKS